MSIHIQRDIDLLKKSLLDIAVIVEDSIKKSTTALLKRDAGLANQVIDQDNEVNTKEVRLEEECLKVLALHQPVATDLRYIMAIFKVNSDLERMGDLAVNIAKYTLPLLQSPEMQLSYDFTAQIDRVQNMVKMSLDALTNIDTKLAKQVFALDDAVDTSHIDAFRIIQEKMQEDSDNVERGVYLLSCSKQLERIADLATNIAEDVLYIVEGDVIRHKI